MKKLTSDERYSATCFIRDYGARIQATGIYVYQDGWDDNRIATEVGLSGPGAARRVAGLRLKLSFGGRLQEERKRKEAAPPQPETLAPGYWEGRFHEAMSTAAMLAEQVASLIERLADMEGVVNGHDRAIDKLAREFAKLNTRLQAAEFKQAQPPLPLFPNGGDQA